MFESNSTMVQAAIGPLQLGKEATFVLENVYFIFFYIYYFYVMG